MTHQFNFQTALQNSDDLREWTSTVLTLADRAFPQLPDIHNKAISRLCYVADDVDAGLHVLDGNPKTMETALDQMQYYQHSRRSKPSWHNIVREVIKDATQSEGRDTDIPAQPNGR